jgi:hypothetical protein
MKQERVIGLANVFCVFFLGDKFLDWDLFIDWLKDLEFESFYILFLRFFSERKFPLDN